MRGVVTSFGSIGDVHPLLALASELRKAGHELIFALAPSLESWVKRYGFEFVSIGSDLYETQRTMMQTMSQKDFQFEQMEPLLIPYINDIPAMFEALEHTCLDADFLISASSFPLAHMLYETTDIPFICVDLESVQGGPGSFTEPLELQLASLLNPFRHQLGLPAVKYPLSLDGYSPDLTLFATSRQLLTPSPKWPARSFITGFFFLDEDNWVPDQPLIDFLAAGEPPIMVNFGSTAHEDTHRLAQIIFDMVEQVGCRAIVQQGWTGLARGKQLPPNVYGVGFISHSWLFPQVAGLICHGGTQTTASAFRHGMPLICVPHTWEHRPSAMFMKSFGTGLVLPYHQLSVPTLSEAVRDILDNPTYRTSVRRLQEKIRTEKGVEYATRLISEFLAAVYA